MFARVNSSARARVCVCVLSVVCALPPIIADRIISLFYLTILGCCTQLVSKQCVQRLPAESRERETDPAIIICVSVNAALRLCDVS